MACAGSDWYPGVGGLRRLQGWLYLATTWYKWGWIKALARQFRRGSEDGLCL